jgi:hypothetical protein
MREGRISATSHFRIAAIHSKQSGGERRRGVKIGESGKGEKGREEQEKERRRSGVKETGEGQAFV